jgi:hypothetical protein
MSRQPDEIKIEGNVDPLLDKSDLKRKHDITDVLRKKRKVESTSIVVKTEFDQWTNEHPIGVDLKRKQEAENEEEDLLSKKIKTEVKTEAPEIKTEENGEIRRRRVRKRKVSDEAKITEPLEKRKKVEETVFTDLSKTFNENVENRFNHWNQVNREIEDLKKKITEIYKKIDSLPDTPENRPIIADCHAEIDDIQNRIRRLNRSNDQIEYLYGVACVLREEDNSVQKGKEDVESCRVNASGPLKPRIRKKVIPNNTNNDSNIFYARPITHFFSGYNDKTKSARKLAQYLNEIPLDINDYEYCPTCVKVIMQFKERPPCMYCPTCGICIEVLDNTSAAVHDKETNTHTPFTYRPKLHFISWVKRITGKLRFTIPEFIKEKIYFKLWQRKIRDLNMVTWSLIDDIVRGIAKSDKRFADYYPHVYQITNIIRGKPILTFTDEEEQEIFEYFDPIFLLWEEKKHMFCMERSNFMYNALVLQIIFMILKYPPDVIKIFNMIKGDTNLRFYDQIIKLICTSLGERTFTTAEIEIMKYGKGKDIMESLRSVNYITNGKEKEKKEPQLLLTSNEDCSVFID